MRKLILVLSVSCLFGCSSNESTKLFTAISSMHSGIDFENTITESYSQNLLTNEYTYMGGGVGIGDFNNDGLSDIFFTASQSSNRLYINEGNFQFRDVTKTAGVTSTQWCTGVSVIDINNDGWEDIYVCVTGVLNPYKRRNLLYINNHNLTFTEMAAAYGLNDDSYSTQAAFFDYDKDGLLDMYLLTHQMYGEQLNRVVPKDLSGNSPRNDRLYHNKGINPETGQPFFENVTKQTGIVEDGYGLGIAVSDFNGDNWPDIYVSNDYIGNDCLWLNQKNGSFRNVIAQSVNHQSYSSMGTEAADINNDGLPDVMTLDMMPEDNESKKMMFSFLSNERHQMEQNLQYEPSYMRNMLQLNRGTARVSDSIVPVFSEIGNYAGIAETDWSWSILAADFDYDGYKDLHITNGLGRDLLNSDFASYSAGKSAGGPNKILIEELQSYGTVPLSNYFFRNNQNCSFQNISATAGINEKAISNGAAYADLDNDSDLDLVVNNINGEAFLFSNNTIKVDQRQVNFLSFTLHGPANNKSGIGSTIKVFLQDTIILLEQNPVRGYLSTVDTRLFTGLGTHSSIDSIRIIWPDNKMQVMTHVRANQALIFEYKNAKQEWKPTAPEKKLFEEYTKESGIQFQHTDSFFFDYAFQRLLPQKFSSLGPGMAVGDVNNDGLEDFFVGNGFRKQAVLYTQKKDGKFLANILEPNGKVEEDTGCLFFDADGDGDEDLIVTSGTNEFPKHSAYYLPRLYLNDGPGKFTRSVDNLPKHLTSATAVVKACDFDKDGDLDLFLGGRIAPGHYPESPGSYLLQNKGGVFTDVTESMCPDLHSAGMITDAVFVDIDGDKTEELVVSGEWMSLQLFKYQNKKFTSLTEASGLSFSLGLWRSIAAADLDKDGDMDLIAGNIGANNKFHFDATHPLNLWYADMDDNGSIDPIIGYYLSSRNGSKELYPAFSLNEIATQVPAIKKTYLLHKDFSMATLPEIFKSTSNLKKLVANEATSCWFENKGKGNFEKHILPMEAQLSPINCILINDFNKDGNRDMLLAGNEYETEISTGRYDAGYGLLLLGNEKKTFTPLTPRESGLFLRGDTRCLQQLLVKDKPIILAAINNRPLVVHKINN